MITLNEYKTFDDAYKFFNDKLFDGELPDCLITLQRKTNGCYGYFHFEKFVAREGTGRISEIALNPDTFIDRDDTEILSTLVHESVHLWQYYLSDPCRKGYHDKDWGRKMEEIGLMPSNTGEPGGKKTGQQMTHYVIEGGKFEIACGAFLAGGKKLSWSSEPTPKKEGSATRNSKIKYACPNCLVNAWVKEETIIVCGKCGVEFVKEE
jgi:hypothetical protein